MPAFDVSQPFAVLDRPPPGTFDPTKPFTLLDGPPPEEPSALASFGQNVAELFKGVPSGAVGLVGTSVEGVSTLKRGFDTGVQKNTRRLLDEIRDTAPGLDDGGFTAFKKRLPLESPFSEDLGIVADLIRSGEKPTTEEQTGAIRRLTRVMQPFGPLNESPLQQAAEGIKEAGAGLLPAEAGFESSIGRQLGEAGGSVVAGILAQILTGGVGTAALFTTAGAGEASERADVGGATEDERIKAAALGILPGATDIIPVEILMRRVPRRQRRKFATFLKRVFQAVVAEGGQEAAQEIMQNAIEREVFNPERPLFDRAPEAGALGGGVGGLVETFLTLVPGARRGRGSRGVAPAAETPTPTVEERLAGVEAGRTAAPEQPAAAPTPDDLSDVDLVRQAPDAFPDVRVTLPGGETKTGKFVETFELRDAEGVTAGVRIVFPDGEVFDGAADDVRIEKVEPAEGPVAAPAVEPTPAAPARIEAAPVPTPPAASAPTPAAEFDPSQPFEVVGTPAQPIPSRPVETSTALTPSGAEIEAQLEIVEARDLVTSHDDDLSVNPAFPQELQPRDRGRIASQQQINEIATALRPELLGRSPTVTDGAPIISPAGVVESGNARVIALRRALAQGDEGAARYRQFLAEQGFDIEGFDQPVLVRRRLTELEPEARQAFVRDANARTTADFSSTEHALSDAEALSDTTLGLFVGGDIDAAPNREFVRSFIESVVPKSERASVVTAGGLLSQEGRARIQGAILAKAYTDSNLIATLTEATDNNIRAIGGALVDVAPALAQLRARVRAGEVRAGMDITPQILAAVGIVSAARRKKQTVEALLAQRDIFSGDPDPVVEDVTRLMFSDRRLRRPVSREKLGKALRFVVEEANKNLAGERLLDLPDVSARDILAIAREKIADQTSQDRDLFAAPQPAVEPGGATDGRQGAGQAGAGGQGPAASRAGEAPAGERAGRGDLDTKLSAGFDPAEAFRSFPRLLQMVREDTARIGEGLRRSTALTPPQIALAEPDASNDLNIFRRIFFTPLSAVRGFPGLQRIVMEGMQADVDQSRFISRLNREYEEIRRPLNEEQFSQLGDILLVGDSQGLEYTDVELRDQGFDAKVVTAYRETRRFFDKLGRFVDQHERAMRPKYRDRKFAILRRMARLRVMDDAEFRLLYGRRSRLRAKIRTGAGDPEVLGRELEDIDAMLQNIREGSEEYQRLLDEVDQIDARLSRLSIRKRLGYFPHKFFGSWRLFRLTERTNEAGETEPFWEHMAGEHGFFAAREEAVRAAKAHLADNPEAQLRVAPVQFNFPNSEATQLSDPAYARFMGKMRENLGLEGEDLSQAVQGVARRRFRRRIAGFSQFRAGVAGYSKDIDRVIVAHTGEVVRYVMMDKLKFDAISEIEKSGLSPNRSSQQFPQLSAMMNNWLRDVNGQKQGFEQSLDNLLNSDKPWVRPINLGLETGTLAFLATGGLTGNPFVGLAVGSYVGFRFFRARQQGGQFPTRAVTGAFLGDMAHLKLGAFFNVVSPLVNLSQTILNTYPVLGEKYTLVGLTKLAAAAKSAVQGTPNNDWRLLERSDVATRFKFSEQSPKLFQREGRMAFWSMFLFNSAEQFNRGVSYLGAFHRAIDQGKSQAAALRDAVGIGLRSPGMIRTQFLYSNANKSEVLRGVLARVPLQFKNFVAQEIAFAFNLRGAEIPRFLLATFLLAGALGIPGVGLIDWLMQMMFDFSPVEEAKRETLKAAAQGEAESTAANLLLRGLPTLIGTDVSTRIGLGDKFLPLQLREFKGPWWSTIEKAAALGELNATMVDQLRNLSSGIGAPLKSLEAAANGLPLFETLATEPRKVIAALGDGEARLTNPWKNGNLEFRPTTGELLQKAIGGRPLREAQLSDVSQIARSDERRAKKKTRTFLNKIVAAFVFIDDDAAQRRRVREVLQEAREEGVILSRDQVKRAVLDAQRTRAERLLRQTRRQARPETESLLRGVSP